MAKSVYMHHRDTDDDGDEVHLMKKFNLDLDADGEYRIMRDFSGQAICNCPARTQVCRHVKMLDMFELAEAGEDDLFNEVAAEHPDKVIMLQTDNTRFEWVAGLSKEALGIE